MQTIDFMPQQGWGLKLGKSMENLKHGLFLGAITERMRRGMRRQINIESTLECSLDMERQIMMLGAHYEQALREGKRSASCHRCRELEPRY